MRQVLSFALAGWLIIAMTMAQACAEPAQSTPPYPSAATPAAQSAQPGSTLAGGAGNGGNGGDANHLVDTTGYTPDRSRSDALSGYLKQRKLPLVGAQVLRSPAGQQMVVLYGFVGSDFGRNDAVAKTRNYLNDPGITVDNRIKVRPELLAAGNGASGESSAAPAGNTAASGSESLPGINSYENQPNETQQYVQQQNTGAAMGSMAPLLMLGLMALSFSSGGGVAVGPGSFGSFGSYGSPGLSPFGAPAPYNPYPGYPSPGPYGGSPFGP
jgi:hypothetical protein